MNWEYKEALNSYRPTLEEHLALKKLKPTLNALIQYADDFYITEVGARTLGRDLNKRPNTISSHLKQLEELGFIEVLDKKGKFGKCNMKRLKLPNVSVNVTVNVSDNVSVNVTDNVTVNVTHRTDTEEKERKGKKSKEVDSLRSSDKKEDSEFFEMMWIDYRNHIASTGRQSKPSKQKAYKAYSSVIGKKINGNIIDYDVIEAVVRKEMEQGKYARNLEKVLNTVDIEDLMEAM